MGAFDHIRPNGVFSPGDGPFVITSRDMALLDEMSTRAVNGDDGGTWAPSSPICIGGSCIQTTTNVSQFIGGIETRSGGRMRMGDNDYPVFSATRGYSVVVPLTNALGGLVDSVNGPTFVTAGSLSLGGFPLSSISIVAASSSGILYVNLDQFVHDGAHLMSGTVVYQVSQQPDNVVPNQISAIVGREHTSGNTGDLVIGAAISPATTTAYFAHGAKQSISLPLIAGDGVNNIIDRTQYSYVAAITVGEGVGVTAQPWLHSLKLDFAQIADMRFK